MPRRAHLANAHVRLQTGKANIQKATQAQPLSAPDGLIVRGRRREICQSDVR